MLEIINGKNIEGVLKRSQLNIESVNSVVREIVGDVKARGDEAVLEFTLRYDGYDAGKYGLAVTKSEISEAYAKVPAKVVTALKNARDNILDYHRRQKREDDVRTEGGRTTGYVFRPVQRVGIYVPGGKAAYPSSVLMCACPAIVAGVEEIVMVTPAPKGSLNPLTVVAADLCGIEKIYKVGGAQAVAALAYGTKSIPKVNFISGPGNIYVAVAKREVYGEVGIDMIAGPSEILIIADKTARPEYVAADMLSQAEHDEFAMSTLITDDRTLAERVNLELIRQLAALPKKDIAEKSLLNYGAIIVMDCLKEAAETANRIAPEHLELAVNQPELLLPLIKNAGAVFMGHFSPEPLGDYYAGPNHVLPTSGTAKFFSPLGVDNYMKRMSVIRYDRESLRAASEDIRLLAETEGLEAHANAVKIRFEEKKDA